MVGQYNIVMDRGATFSRDLKWSIAEKPVDLTGWSGFLVVQPDYDTDVVLFDLTTENGEITFDSNGGIHLEAPASETAVCPSGLYVYNLFVQNTKQVTKLLQGTWLTRPSVGGYLEENE